MTKGFEFYGEPLSEWQSYEWWPTGRKHRIHAGMPGHDRELVLNIDGYDMGEHIDPLVCEALEALLPDTWKVENRSTRIECHPTGWFAGGFEQADIDVLDTAARTLLGT